MNKNERVAIANETLDILSKGQYINPGKELIDISAELQYTVANTIHYTPDDFENVLIARDKMLQTTVATNCTYEVTSETTFGAAARLILEEGLEDICCLNFASAKNPGGGFLGGAQAQEESLARASGLYASLKAKPAMYHFNRAEGNLLYSDHMIYSPLVPVFRNDADQLIRRPYFVSIITSPAVNRGALIENQPNNAHRIATVMLERIEKLLSVAVVNKQSTLVLGAWGCGVFRNKTTDVAAWFAHHLLHNEVFRHAFRKVVFAIYDPSEKKQSKDAFLKEFSRPFTTVV